MRTHKIEFPGHDGGMLSGRLEMPLTGSPRFFAVFAHCFTCSKNLTAVANISRALTQHGIAVLRFDFTGLGESSGDFEDTNFSSNVEDLSAAIQFVKENYQAPQLLVGHSLGGAAVLMAALRDDSIKAVATIGSPAEPEHVKGLLSSGINEIEEEGKAEISIGGRPFTIKKHFLEDLQNNALAENLRSLKAALLILHSPDDTIVGINNAQTLYTAATHPKSFITLDAADHLLSRSQDSNYAGNVIASWSERYTDVAEEEEETKHGSVLVRTTDSYTTEIRTAHHSLLADEPKSLGGNNLGPTPYGLLLASLGSCTSITLRMYINRKQWDVQEINVHLEHEKVHSKDCEDCESESGMIDIIQMKLEFIGNLDESQRARLLEIAHKCPVHKTMTTETKIKASLI